MTVPVAEPSVAGAPGWYPGCPATVDDALAAGRPLRPARWGIGDAVGTLVAALLLAVVAALVLEAAGGGLPSGVQLLVGLLVPWLALAGWPLLATAWRGNGPTVDLGLRLTWRDAGMGLLGGVVALVLGGVAAALTAAVLGDFGSAAGDAAQEIADSGQRLTLFVFAVMVAVGAPVVEELAFRGLLFASLAKRGLPPWLSIGITTVAFALFHFEPKRLLVLLVIGTVLGVLRWRTRALGASIVAHAVNNLPGAVGLLVIS